MCANRYGMKLYYAPMSCSLAVRMALYEAGFADETSFHRVDLVGKRVDGDGDYWAVNAKGQVPALVTRDGELLTENAAVLQYVADLAPASGLAPTGAARYRLQQWLSYVGGEVHKAVFWVAFSPLAPAEAKQDALTRVLPQRMAYLERELATRPFLVGDQFTVADAYLTTALTWLRGVQLDVATWPAVAAYHARMLARPAVARAVRDEYAEYRRA